MLRVFQAVVVLMGGLLLWTTNLVGQARDNQPPPYEMMLHQYRQNNLVDSWLLFNPYTGQTRPFMAGVVGVTFLGWSADGALIYSALDLTSENYRLYRTENPDQRGALLADGLALPDGIWSTDRRYLLVQQMGVRGSRLLSVRTDGGGSAVLKGGLDAGRQMAIADYAFSPDGESVAMTVRQARSPSVVVARLDGTALTDVTPAGGKLMSVQAWLPAHDGLIVHIDGKLYWVDPSSGAKRRVTAEKGYQSEYVAGWTAHPITTGWIGIVETKSGSTPLHVVLCATGESVWDEDNVRLWLYSPDGARLMLIAEDGTWALLEVRSQQRRALELPFGGVNTQQPIWSPDGRYVVAVSHEGGLLTRFGLWRLDVRAGSKFVPLWETGDGIFDPFWVPSGDRLLVYSNSALQTGMIWLRPDGSDRGRLTDVNELGQHDFAAWGPPIEKDWSQRPYLWGVGVGLWGVGLLMVGAGWPWIAQFATRRRN